MSKSKLIVVLLGACAVGALTSGAIAKNPVLLALGAICLFFAGVEILLITLRAYSAKKGGETLLAYKALAAWGDFADEDADAFVKGWLDQVLDPATPAPIHRSEAAKAAYWSGWIASRDRDTFTPSTADRVL